jgi:hypothetical protein
MASTKRSVKVAKDQEGLSKEVRGALSELGVDFDSIKARVTAHTNAGQLRQIVGDAVRSNGAGGAFSEARLIDWLIAKLSVPAGV